MVKDLGYSWKKAHKLLGRASRQARAQFITELAERLDKTQDPDGPVVLFCDEAHVGTDTQVGYGWAPLGARLFVSSHSPPLWHKRTCFGAYAYGEPAAVCLQVSTGADSAATCDFVKTLRTAYPHRRLVVVWDNVAYHRTQTVKLCAQTLGIELCFLPPYSPDLMPVERLWQWLREELQALHCHLDLEELDARIAGFAALLQESPAAVHRRLYPKLHLGVDEEKLRL